MRPPRLLFALLLAAAGCFGNQRPPDGGTDGFSTDAFPFPCGDMDCAPSQVCYLDAPPTGEQCLLPTDAGTCPPGTAEGNFTPDCPPGALNCDPIPRPPRCGDLPVICGGAPTCLCLRTSCVMITGAVCRAGFEVGNIYCWR